MPLCVLSCLSRVRLTAMQGTIVFQALLSMRFFRQEYCSGLPCPSPGNLSDPGIKPAFLMSPALAGRFFLPLVPPGKPRQNIFLYKPHSDIHAKYFMENASKEAELSIHKN